MEKNFKNSWMKKGTAKLCLGIHCVVMQLNGGIIYDYHGCKLQNWVVHVSSKSRWRRHWYLHNNICEYRPPSPKYSVYKVMQDQFHFEKYYENFELDYLQKSDEIYYTLRENVSDQIKSYVYAQKQVTGILGKKICFQIMLLMM